MTKHTTAVTARRRGVALSAAIAMMTLSGFTSATAHAGDITLDATVELCEISLSTPSTWSLDWGGNVGSAYAFTAEGANAITLDWSGDGQCAGNLKAHRDAIVKDQVAITGATLSLNGDLIDETLANAWTVSNMPGPESFDVTMVVPEEAAPGTFSTTLTFTVVAG